MAPRRWAWAIGAWLLQGMAVAKPVYAVTPAPDWVRRIDEPVSATVPAPVAGGQRWLLVDQQVRLAQGTTATYRHTVAQAVDASGVDGVTSVDVTYDPSYQSLALHDVRIWRAGEARSQMKQLESRVLQREPDLDSRIYDGRQTVSLLLRDVRPGDAVEVAYTLTGANPVFAGHRFGEQRLQTGTPLLHNYRRVLTDDGAPLGLRLQAGAPSPVTGLVDGKLREWVWDQRDVPALHSDPRTPETWDGWAAVEYSDFHDWASVVHWALPLYRVPGQLPAALQAERDALMAANATPQARIAAALRRVQGEVRYLGVEMGANSHAPRPPDEVFARRYGDCKEKTLLLVTLLRAMAIDASPALVDTSRREAIATLLPSPNAFDHAVTRVRLDGREYWLDATRLPQAGDLDHLGQAHFGQALVIAPEVTALEAMAPQRPADDSADETMDLDLRYGGVASAPFQVSTIHRGADADDLRRQIAGKGLDELQASYLSFYANTWPGARVSAPMTVDDDPTANSLTLVEHYWLPHAWNDAPGDGKPNVVIEPDEVFQWLKRPPRGPRKTPLDIGDPLERHLLLKVELPAIFSNQQRRERVDTPEFDYERQLTSAEDHLEIDYRFHRLSPVVAAEAVAAYGDKMQEARTHVGWRLTAPVARHVWEWRVVALMLCLLMLVKLTIGFIRRGKQPVIVRDRAGPGTWTELRPVEGWALSRLRGVAASTCILAGGWAVLWRPWPWIDGGPWRWTVPVGVAVLLACLAVALAESKVRKLGARCVPPPAWLAISTLGYTVVSGALLAVFWQGLPRPMPTSGRLIVVAGAGLILLQWLHWVLSGRQRLRPLPPREPVRAPEEHLEMIPTAS